MLSVLEMISDFAIRLDPQPQMLPVSPPARRRPDDSGARFIGLSQEAKALPPSARRQRAFLP